MPIFVSGALPKYFDDSFAKESLMILIYAGINRTESYAITGRCARTTFELQLGPSFVCLDCVQSPLVGESPVLFVCIFECFDACSVLSCRKATFGC